MGDIARKINIISLLNKKSVFLFGPRQTGKSTLIRQKIAPSVPNYNLLNMGTYRRLSANPSVMRQEILSLDPKPQIVVIDEIQKLPELLNEVHLLIEEEKIHFLLTGSSARVLKRKGMNLLGGRARSLSLFPLCYGELQEKYDLVKAANSGLLPSLYFSEDLENDLGDYVGTYLREEIAAEGLSRSIPSFSRFLEIAALSNTQIINYTNIASDAEVKRSTVVDYFQILKDTRISFELEAWQKKISRKPIKTSKFYFFDVGVVRFLQQRNAVLSGSTEFGFYFEHLVLHELKCYSEYVKKHSLHYWRTTTGFEIDLIWDERVAIEIKAKTNLHAKDLSGIKAIQEEKICEKHIVVYLGETMLRMGSIQVYPWKMFFDLLWSDGL